MLTIAFAFICITNNLSILYKLCEPTWLFIDVNSGYHIVFIRPHDRSMEESSDINTLSEFLMQAQTQYLVFDLGRGIRLINNQVFFEWENQQTPCAYPRQGHAWFCIVFWNQKVSQEQYIWFIKLPLDENGLLEQASRNQFLDIIVKALGQNLDYQEAQAKLPENPYIFEPNQQQLADCNAHIRAQLKLATNASQERKQQIFTYMSAPQLQKDALLWQQFSVQDISDFVIANNYGIDTLSKTISSNLAHYPKPVLHCLLASLESITLNEVLVDALIDLHRQCKTPQCAALCLRAMSFNGSNKAITYIQSLINMENTIDIESKVVITGRYWQIFKDPQLLMKYMYEICVNDENNQLFKSIYADLVRIPSIRPDVLNLLRNPERPEALSRAIGSLFSS